MTTIEEHYRTRAHTYPGYYTRAASHPFTCNCEDCLTFLVIGARGYAVDMSTIERPIDVTILDTEVRLDSDGLLIPSQVRKLRALFNRIY